MKRSLLIVLLFLSAYSFGAETGFGQLSLSCSAVTTTGACTTFNVHPPDFVHVPQANSFTWQTIFSGGTATSITIRLEGSIDGTSFSTIDTSTSTAGETRTKTTAAYNYFRCNVAAYSPNGTNVSCQITPQFVQGGGASAVDSVNGQTGTVVLAASDVGSIATGGNAGTATALAANGANCSAGQAAQGVNASGAAEGCYTTGTVSSVAQTVPSGLSISGSPVTGSGTLAITWTSAADQILLSTASNTAGFAAVPSCSAGTSALTYNTTTHAFGCNSISAGTGTVTSVGHTVNGGSSSGIFAITGSPVTTSGTLDLALALTSGGIPYASSTSVLSSSALLTSNSPVMGGGAGAAPKTLTFLTTNGTNEVDIGVAGGGNGVLGLKGNTSGTATITAPAVAGTNTNAIVISNAIAVPVTCSALTYSFATDLTTGICDNSTGVMIVKANGTLVNSVESTGLWAYSAECVGFKSSGFSNDTCISRDAAATVDIGSSQGNKSGRVNAATVSTGTATWSSGTGTPEAAVTAPIGSLFTRTDGGTTTTLYVKESGAGNTGWIAK